jgi:surfactin family lipopeptide synthetase A
MTVSIVCGTSSDEDTKVFPAAFAQQRLWFLDQLEPQRATYNVPAALRLQGRLDVQVLADSLNALVQRHAALRTTFGMSEGQLVQVIAPGLRLPLPVVDLRDLAEAQRETEVGRLATEEARQPFDLSRGPLVRVTFLQLAAEAHLLLLTLHHIVADACSINVLVGDLATLYQALSRGEASPLPELPLQYADFALWQREWVQGDAFSEQLAYWTQTLQGAPASLDLPIDHPRPPVKSSRGALQRFALSPRLTAALKALSQQQGVSLYMSLMAAFSTLLHRYSGQDELLLGAFTTGRSRPETQTVIGCFANTLVLRSDLSGNPSFRELLGRVREVISAAEAHGEVPFEQVIKQLQPERSMGHNPLFQVLLTLAPLPPVLPWGWSLSQLDGGTGSAKFDLSLELADRAEGLLGRVEYSTDLFEASTIARMVGHWQALLEGIVANPEQRLSELPLLTEAERHQQLVEWNGTQAEYPKNTCLHQLFEAQVERTPEAVAVVFEDERLTYQELNMRSNHLAHYLQQLGVGPEVLVGICVERSLEMVVGLLGILKAGGAYVPLDPTYPAERLAFMLKDAQVPVLVTQQRLLAGLPEHQTKVVCLDADWECIAEEKEGSPISGVTAANLAYVIYTSGSTGKPKGVQVLHRAVVNFLLSMRQQPGLTAEDTLLAVTTLSFDIAALEVFLPLIVGARLIVASRAVVTNGTALAETLSRTGTTVMQATPITWRLLLVSGWPGKQRVKILCGGEALPLELARQLLPRAAALWNLYGPTETTIWSTVCKIEPGDEAISIGHPIANTQIHLLDNQLQLVPIGVPGELCIGGAGLARGYLNRPDLTAERFIRHPWSAEPGARLYRTGDLARYRPDGSIEVLGRLDHQVKLRGFRIELGEIEAVLGQHPAVRQAVVVARQDVPRDKRLVAYIVATQGQLPAINTLRSFLKEQLPEYMVPVAFVLLEALPLTPNGKVDRGALPAPERTSSAREESFVASTSMEHYQLLQIWEELLNMRPIGIGDNFFDVGGHSLLAVRLVARIEQVFGKQLPLATLFASPTIEQLATALQQQDSALGELPGKEDRGSRAHVVAVQVGRAKRPFFYLHGEWGHDAFYCFPLARALGADQPFYTLEPYKFEGLRVPPTMEAMAAAHLEAMRAVQPEGPYLLGGWCNGGLLAYEVARQLHVAGQTVDLLVLMNAWSVPVLARWVCGLIRRLGTLLRLGQDRQVDWFLRLRHVYNSLRFAHYRNSRRFALVPTAEALRQENWMDIFDWVASAYVPGQYPGEITFFWDEEEPFGRVMWSRMAKAKEAEVHLIAGTHITSRTEYLQALAAQLKTCLDKAQVAPLN